MAEKLNALSIAAYVRGARLARKMKNSGIRLARSLKEDERGLSGIVVAVLLILVAVLAVVLLWDLLEQWIGNLWTTITGTADGIR